MMNQVSQGSTDIVAVDLLDVGTRLPIDPLDVQGFDWSTAVCVDYDPPYTFKSAAIGGGPSPAGPGQIEIEFTAGELSSGTVVLVPAWQSANRTLSGAWIGPLSITIF